jgi:hypothetical protein
MSVHDLGIEVVCDGPKCDESIVYEEGQGWRDSDIERRLRRDEWIAEDGRHYCSQECQAAGGRG